jgi:hypothetical protein
MQQGMLSSLLLSLFLFCAWPSAASIEITSDTAQKWLQEEQIRHKSAELLQYAVHDELDSLRFSLQRLALPQQEAARFLLLQKIEQLELVLTPNMVLFIEEQQALAPTYQVVEKEQGYEFSTPAFDSSAIASRLLKRWRQEQTILDFLVKAERQELVLKTWLSGTQYQVKIRETLLIRELDTLSPSALAAFTEQLTSELVTGWLPSTQVMVRLAQVSEDPKIYKLLWLLWVDFSIQQELTRLASVSDEFAIKQIMAASENPSLKVQAIKALVRISPMRPDIRDFLIAKMSINEEVNLVATALVEQGHSRWLKDLLVSNSQVKSRGILQALSQ